jgi:hypothetical protein
MKTILPFEINLTIYKGRFIISQVNYEGWFIISRANLKEEGKNDNVQDIGYRWFVE